jgi:hypothetical protein
MHNIERQEAMSLHSSAVPSVFNILPSMEGSLTNTLPVSYSIAVGTIDTPQLLANMDNIAMMIEMEDIKHIQIQAFACLVIVVM